MNGSIFGVNRDIRFAKDKTPYKDHIDIWLWEVLYHLHDPARIEAAHQSQSYGMLSTVDLHVNSRARRAFYSFCLPVIQVD